MYTAYQFRVSKNYNLTKEEEKDIILYINSLLEEFETQLDLLPLETIYFSIMPLGRKICETMMSLLLKKEGYSIATRSPFMETLQFSYKNNFISQKNYQILNAIRIRGNKALHAYEEKYGELLSFLKDFSDFINWFNTSFNDEKSFNVDEVTLKINYQLNNSNYTYNPLIPIERYPRYSKYRFYKKEEKEDIYQINQLLRDYGKQLKLISNEKKFYYTFLGSTISELMLKLLVKKERIYSQNNQYHFYQYINILYEYEIIPKECKNFLHLIRKYRNRFIHGTKQSNKLVLSFLKALNYFIQWFDNYYSVNYQQKFQIEECCELIDSLNYDEKSHSLTFVEKEQNFQSDTKLKINKFKTEQDITHIKKEIRHLEKEKNKKEPVMKELAIDCFHSEPVEKKESNLNEEIERLNELLDIKEELYEKQIQELNKKNEEILNKLDEYGKLFGRCLKIISQQGNRIESKIDNLHEKMDNISREIHSIQSLTERQINNAESPAEIERIIETYINQCIDNIMSQTMIFKENQNYQIEKQKLIYSIGEESWNKLCEKSKTFLITSKVMYNHLITMEDIIDYSGICVLVTKALEVEIHKRFFTNFLDYLNEKYGSKYKEYHTALLYQKRKPLLNEKFTMGNIAFVMCYIENWNDTDEQKIKNKLRLMEYCKERVFSNYTESEIQELLTEYASKIEEIREKYRNPSAHTNEIKRIEAEECFNLVLDIEKLLKRMLDSFDK